MRLEELLIYVLECPKMSGFNDLQGDDARCFRSCQQHIWLENISAVAIGGKHGIVGLNVGGAGILVVNTNQLGAREPHGLRITFWPETVPGVDIAQNVLVELDDVFNVVHIHNPKHSVHFV